MKIGDGTPLMSGDGDAESTSDEVWERTMAVNLKGVFLGCKYGIPAIRRSGGGSIINTASFVALMGAATPQLAYTASKGGVLAMTRELAVIHARENIRVNSLCPGPLQTEMLMSFLNTEEKKQRRLVHILVAQPRVDERLDRECVGRSAARVSRPGRRCRRDHRQRDRRPEQQIRRVHRDPKALCFPALALGGNGGAEVI